MGAIGAYIICVRVFQLIWCLYICRCVRCTCVLHVCVYDLYIGTHAHIHRCTHTHTHTHRCTYTVCNYLLAFLAPVEGALAEAVAVVVVVLLVLVVSLEADLRWLPLAAVVAVLWWG